MHIFMCFSHSDEIGCETSLKISLIRIEFYDNNSLTDLQVFSHLQAAVCRVSRSSYRDFVFFYFFIANNVLNTCVKFVHKYICTIQIRKDTQQGKT